MHAKGNRSSDWRRQRRNGFIVAVLSAAFIVSLAASAAARDSSASGRASTGRELALRACTGCHIVSPDQPFAPVIDRTPPPPDFRTVANMPNTTAASLRQYLSHLPTVPAPGRMADPYLSRDEREDIIAFIMTLREAR
jgi:mono/diheme cytochrome c family protein